MEEVNNDRSSNNREKLHKKDIKTEVINLEVILSVDKQGYIAGVKVPDESNFLGKSIKDLK